MRVLVIGAYGFIGSAVVARLVADGHEVVGAGRRIKAARERRLCNPGGGRTTHEPP